MKHGMFVALSFAPLVALAEVVDFEDADGKTPLSGWKFALTDEGGAPRWEIVNDPTSPMQSSVLAQLSEDRTPGRFPLAISAGEHRSDLSAAAMTTASSTRFRDSSGAR
jgi:hypothetical protein